MFYILAIQVETLQSMSWSHTYIYGQAFSGKYMWRRSNDGNGVKDEPPLRYYTQQVQWLGGEDGSRIQHTNLRGESSIR